MTEALAVRHEPSDPIRRIEELSGQKLFACYQCGRCTAECPFMLSPQLVMRLVQLGQIESARNLITTWECAKCDACGTGCPKGVNPARVMKALRSLEESRPLNTLVPRPAGQPMDTFAGSRAMQESKLSVWLTAKMRALRASFFSSMPDALRLMSKVSGLANLLLNVPGVRLLMHLFLGLHKSRTIPPLASESFGEWFKRHQPLGDGHRGTVALFHDTLNDYNYPQTQIAATELLEKAGYNVELTNTVCCGRPAISQGKMDVAERAACTNVPRLYELAKQGILIVGCEPSCLLTLRNDYLDLVPKELQEQAKVVAKHVLLIDEFVMILKNKGELDVTFKAPEPCPEVIFHGHCHQKSEADATKSLDALDLAGYHSVQFVNAACCGMAGAYGYEKEHYDLSEAAGNRALLPLIRNNPNAQVVVMGVSCREQIEHFTGRQVKHLAEALRDATEK
jgi:Fe-S oxidoreductase